MPSPLSGLRVLDMSTTFSGPYCGQILADLGADVIKVESPQLDVTRSLGLARTPGLASVYVSANHGKAPITLDLKDPSDYQRFLELVSATDVLLHNMRASATQRLGIDYETLNVDAPHLIYASITGYGSDGPYAARPAYDDTIQAMSGLVWSQSRDAHSPTYMKTSVADKTAGMMAAIAVLAAVNYRTRTGTGQTVEIPMFETLVSWTLMEELGGMAFQPPEGPPGYERARHRRPYSAKDGLIAVVVYHDGHWQRFLEYAGMGDLLNDVRFNSVASRLQHLDDLYGRLGDFIAERTIGECLALFEQLDIPATEIKTTEELFQDPHLKAVELFRTTEHPTMGKFQVARSPMLFSVTPAMDPQQMSPPQMPGEGEAKADSWLDSARPWGAQPHFQSENSPELPAESRAPSRSMLIREPR